MVPCFQQWGKEIAEQKDNMHFTSLMTCIKQHYFIRIVFDDVSAEISFHC